MHSSSRVILLLPQCASNWVWSIKINFSFFNVLDRRDKPFQRPLVCTGHLERSWLRPRGRWKGSRSRSAGNGRLVLLYSQNSFHSSEIQASRKTLGLTRSGHSPPCARSPCGKQPKGGP